MVRIQRKDSTLGDVAGSGLGLHIVRQIADMHGAETGVHSEEGAGSTFWISFPKAEQIAAARSNWYHGVAASERPPHA